MLQTAWGEFGFLSDPARWSVRDFPDRAVPIATRAAPSRSRRTTRVRGNPLSVVEPLISRAFGVDDGGSDAPPKKIAM